MLQRWSGVALLVLAAAVALSGANEEGSGEASSDEAAAETADSTFAGRCYQCNSKTEPDCGETGALLENEAKFLRQCDPLSTANGMFHKAEAIGCRKAVQIVEAVEEGAERISRECAYGGENVDGQKKTGNKGIRVYYYQCDNEDGCNGAPPAAVAQWLGALLAPLAAAALLRR